MIDGEADVAVVEDEAPLVLTDEIPDDLPAAAVEDDAPEEDGGEIEISFDGEEPIIAAAKPADNSLIRDFRKQRRADAAEIARLKALVEVAPVAAIVELGPVPTLESVDWDENALAAAIEARAERKHALELQQAAQQEAAAKQAAADAAEAAEYVKARSALGARDYDDAEASFVEAFPNPAFQRLVVRASDNPAAVIYALHRAPAKLAELAAITDAAKLAAAIGKMEARLKVVKKSAVQPERRVSGAAPVRMNGADTHMARLEAEAERTNDRSKIYAYKRQLAAKAAPR